jgi:hypothetical protein
MSYSRILAPIGCLLAAAFLASAQAPPPAPPAPPAAPFPVATPMPVIEPFDFDFPDLEFNFSFDKELHLEFDSDFQDKVETLREQAGAMRLDAERQAAKALTMVPDLQETMEAAKDVARRMKLDYLAFAQAPPAAPVPPVPPMPPASPKGRTFRGMSGESLYSEGQRSLDSRHWDEAVESFNQVISRGGARVDGALYWKAYALGKLGRRDEALAAIAELRKSDAGTRWLDDAKALELELKQASGQNVAPEVQDDEDLKLMAINGLMQSDPERAIPLLERQLKGSASPKVKRNTLFVLAQSNSPKAQAMLEQVARGGANPDLQLKAIRYMNERRRPNNNAQTLSEIYAGTNDLAIKRAILEAYNSMGEKDRLLQLAKTEKAPDVREYAISALAGNRGTPELWQLYQAETTPEGKLQLLHYMYSNSNAEKLLEIVRTEKDPKVRAEAVRVLASQRAGVTADMLVSVYNAEQDQQIKMRILDGLSSQRNAKSLVDIARAEKDSKMKLRIVERLSNMKSKEASDYLEELLKK